MKSFQIGDITIPVPIVQGGMGIGISLSGLASAVATAGGIGTIATVGVGLIHGTPDKSFRQNNIDGVIREIRKARQLTNGVLAVNIMSVLTNFDDLVRTSIDEKIDVIFSGAGLPLDLPKYKTEGCNTKLVPIVSSGRAAQVIAQKWLHNFNYLPDAFVVEGPEAGGHLGFSYNDLNAGKHNLDSLVKDVLKITGELAVTHNRNIPVIAGGGIINGKRIHEILSLGASAVQLGSSFIATKECDASDEFKEVIINASEKDIRLIQSPVGLPGRAVENEFLLAAERGEKRPKSCKFNCIKSCNPKTTSYCIADALYSAYYGRFDSGFAFSGAKAYQIKAITTVDEVFQRMIREYENELL
ncbi:MAG: nitronate monooxygenase [Marinilabiliaceae bacterium]|nr:nitronate monooxygenase [Marinilabiliaceae bacterium]